MVGRTNVGGGGGKMFAIISVTYPEGSVCTCTNGTKTLKAKDTSGKALFNVSAGEWTVTATDGNKTKSVTVSITAEGQSESVELIYSLMLYDSGDEIKDITGGWVVNNAGSKTSIVKESTSIQIKMKDFAQGQMADHTVGIKTTNLINVSKYSQLELVGSNYSGKTASAPYCHLTVRNASNATLASEHMYLNGDLEDFVVSVDISKLSTDAIILVEAYYASFDINSIKLILVEDVQ